MSEGDEVKIEPADDGSWESYFHNFLHWAAREPYTFLFYVLAILSPFFVISAILSYKLSQALEKQEKKMKQKRAMTKAIKKAKKEE